MEIWGLCPACQTWFFCEGWLDWQQPSLVCPTCGLEPRAIENRAAASSSRPSSNPPGQRPHEACPLPTDAQGLAQPGSVQRRRSVIICSHCRRPVAQPSGGATLSTSQGGVSALAEVGARRE